MNIESKLPSSGLKVASLFSGIGGFELGLRQAGHETVFMCESDEVARSVLQHHFPEVEIAPDVTTVTALPYCDLVTAGWPCQDISQAGTTRGLGGSQSGLVSEVFRLVSGMTEKPRFILLENVAFALELKKGEAVRYVTEQLSALGYRWSYRVLNTKLFGVPQRRRRLFVLGALVDDPEKILLDGILNPEPEDAADPSLVGFYWTEGNRGVGWSPNSVPPLKGGSGVGIPSPPAIWNRRTSEFFTPNIEDAERLQGFPVGWTAPAESFARGQRRRWMLVGNAVSVPVAEWIGGRLSLANDLPSPENRSILSSKEYSKAGSGGPLESPRFYSPLGEGPAEAISVRLEDFGLNLTTLLSQRAASGFTRRFEVAPLKKDPEFPRDLRKFLTPLQA